MDALNVKVEDVSSIKKELSFEIGVEIVDAAMETAFQKVAKGAKVKGFRKGKVPRGLIEQNYGAQMQQEALDQLIKESYFKALVEHKIPAISGPEITDTAMVEKGKPFSYTVQVEVKPEVEVKNCKGLKLQSEKLELAEDFVDNQLEEMRTSRSELEVTSRKMARKGDTVIVDFEGFLGDEAFENGSATDHQLELGSGSFIPGFEEQVERMKREEEKEIKVTFPENYGSEDLAGKDVVFKVVLKEIKEKVLPELDDEFSKGFGMESLPELKANLQQNYERQEQDRVKADLRERLMAALVEANPVEAPEGMIRSQLEYMFDNTSKRLQSQGMSIEMLGMTQESFSQMYRDAALKQVQGSLLLEAVAKQEEIKVEDSEIDDKLQLIAEQSNAPVEAVKEYYLKPENKGGLVSHLVEEKGIEFLLEQAEVVEVPKSELEDKSEEGEKE